MKNWGIRAQVIILALIPTALVAVIMGTYFISSRVQDLNINVKDRGMTIASYLAQTAEYGLLSRNTEALRKLVASARDGDDDILAVAIFAKNNLLLASSGTKQLVSNLVNPSEDEILLTIINPASNGYIARSPIVSQPTVSNRSANQQQSEIPVIGYVGVLITDKNVQLRQYQTTVTAVIILIIGLILGGILAHRMAKNITKPIIQLANAVKRIKEGQLKIAIKSNSTGELKTLVEGFNDMSDSLYEAKEEMQSNIDQATADINATNTTLEEQAVKYKMAQKEAEESSRVKSEFLANMSHEIRTPMNGVIGFTNLLLRSNLTSKQFDYLSTIKKSANSLLSIIDNILDFSKIEAGKMELENNHLSINDCIDETLNLLAPAAQAKNIEILSIVYQDVPQNLKGDSGKIKQILTNLCNNAIKFTEKGTIQIRVMLEEEYDNAIKLRVNITDTGIGLSKEQQKILFQAFTQADTTTTRAFGGTGLGLVISKKLVEAMNGKIGIDSKEDIGSTFWFTMKLELDFDRQKKLSLGFPGRKILLHDASPISQLATKHLLKRWETETETSDDFEQLIASANSHFAKNKEVHLIMIGGYSADKDKDKLIELNKIAKKLETPLAVLVNSKEDRIIQEFEKLDLKKHISKPITRKPLYDALYRWFDIDKQFNSGHNSDTYANKQMSPINILCVDDNTANLKLIDAFLSDFNVLKQIVDSGIKAIEVCKTNSFDIIFMDIQMPIMDGLETSLSIRKINQHYKTIPIIALTAHAMKGEKERLLNEGMDDYLTKPISQNQLQDSIQSWTKKSVYFKQSPSALSDADSAKVLDLSIDWQLSLKNAGGRDELARDLLKMLVASFSEARELVQLHLDLGNLKELTAQIHKLHGATAYCGVPELKDIAEQYENFLKTDGITQEVLALHKLFMAQLDKIESDAKLILDLG